MAVTDTQIKNVFNINDAQLARVYAWLGDTRGIEGTVTADDLIAAIRQTLKEQVISYERTQASVVFD